MAMRKEKRVLTKAFKDLLKIPIQIEEIEHPLSKDLHGIRINGKFAMFETAAPTIQLVATDDVEVEFEGVIEGDAWKQQKKDLQPTQQYALFVADPAPCQMLAGIIDHAATMTLLDIISFLIQYELAIKLDKLATDEGLNVSRSDD